MSIAELVGSERLLEMDPPHGSALPAPETDLALEAAGEFDRDEDQRVARALREVRSVDHDESPGKTRPSEQRQFGSRGGPPLGPTGVS